MGYKVLPDACTFLFCVGTDALFRGRLHMGVCRRHSENDAQPPFNRTVRGRHLGRMFYGCGDDLRPRTRQRLPFALSVTRILRGHRGHWILCPQRRLTSVDEALATASDGDRYILVDLYAEWCGWCKVLEKEVFTSPEFFDFTGDMVLLRVDVDDGGEGSDLQMRFGAMSLPTTLILDADQVKIGEVMGYEPTTRFIAKVRAQLDEFAAMLEFYDQVKKSGDIEVMRRLAEDFHGRGDGARAAALYQVMLGEVESGAGGVPWLHYLSADAYRLGGELSRAESSLRRAQSMAGGLEDPELLERLDLLRFYIAHDSGDCREAVASLESFLESYPQSGYRSQARRDLTAIRAGKGMECT